jgi:hypothetical protein
VTGRTASGVIMALRHRELPIHGVQFHPESVLTDGGHRMLGNWMAEAGHPPPRAPWRLGRGDGRARRPRLTHTRPARRWAAALPPPGGRTGLRRWRRGLRPRSRPRRPS